ncbi:glycoside hydrolase family 26 protein [Streptomyces sp. PsTaAH-124]|uniref:glycoside hydrolase family 26 protein n=1 Tax=Streptomyces sp. PsTaAH-124 TaxID=1157638 RepID=UPI0003AAFD57|nr:glycosyl hydrolase [Streptomyces sp. PsTaAH-124]
MTARRHGNRRLAAVTAAAVVSAALACGAAAGAADPDPAAPPNPPAPQASPSSAPPTASAADPASLVADPSSPVLLPPGTPLVPPDPPTAVPDPPATEASPGAPPGETPGPPVVPPGPSGAAESPSAPAATPSPPAPPAPPASPTASPVSPVPLPAQVPGMRRPAFGAFLESDARGVARMAQLSSWLGGAELRVGHTYLPGDRWRDIEGAPGFLDVWAQWRQQRPDRLLVLNVPLLERNEDHFSDGQVRYLLRQGAAGLFDAHFRALAQRLVALRVPDTVLVLGWEMNGTTYTHRCGPDPEAWKTYWRHIVTAMRSVPGQRFRFDFAPNRGRDAVPWTACYPGDDVVDIVGMDSYDQPTGLTFDQQVREPYGLQAHVDFAKAHHKPVSYPEWGLFRNGDNAAYMRSMLAWFDAHRPLYNTLTDYCPHGVWQCAANPASSRVYRAILFGRTDLIAPTPTPPGIPLLPQAPAPQPETSAPQPETSAPQPAPAPTPPQAPALTPPQTMSPTPPSVPAPPSEPAPAPLAAPVADGSSGVR